MAATVLEFYAGRRGGKTALQWHLLKQESARVGRPIVCVECERPHSVPPPLGRCACGCFSFGLKTAAQLQPSLDFHGGEQ